MRYQYGGGPRTTAGLTYFCLGLMFAMIHFESDMEKRIDGLWFIYMKPMYLEQNVTVLLLSALLSLGLAITFFSTYFTDFCTRPMVAAVLAGVAVLLLIIAIFTFSRPVLFLNTIGTLCAMWAWRFKNPDNNWFRGNA
jgi:hypothetical protein